MAELGKVTITGHDAALRMMRELRLRANDQRPAWREVGRYMRRITREQFRTEGVRLLGRRWQPLSPPYAARKRAMGFTTGILRRTGRMARSFRVLDIRKDSMTYGSRMDRARWHQTGAGNNPERPILVANRRVSRDINRILTDYLTKNLP